MNILILSLLIVAVAYFMGKYIISTISRKLDKTFMAIRESEDEYYKLSQEKSKIFEELQKEKSKIFEEIEKKQNKLNELKKEIFEIQSNETLNSTQKGLITKKQNDVLKLEIEIEKLYSKEYDKQEKDISEIDLRLSKIIKVDLTDFNFVEQFILTKHTKKLIKESRKRAERGFGVVIVHNEAGEKIYIKRYQKRMLINGGIYFHNPAMVKLSWFGVPVEHFDDGDPEPKNMGNNWYYPMGAEEIAATMYDQKVPTEDNFNIKSDIARYIMYAVFAGLAIYWLFSVYSGDGASATEVGKTLVEAGKTTVVGK